MMMNACDVKGCPVHGAEQGGAAAILNHAGRPPELRADVVHHGCRHARPRSACHARKPRRIDGPEARKDAEFINIMALHRYISGSASEIHSWFGIANHTQHFTI